MNLSLLEKVLQAKSIPALNRAAGTTYDISECIDNIKISELQRYCKMCNVQLAETAEDTILSILENKPSFTNHQSTLISILHKYGYHGIALEPTLLEGQPHKTGTVTESKMIVENTQELHVNTDENEAADGNEAINSLIEKLQMCYNYGSLFSMDEYFNSIGMSIQEANGQKMICIVTNGEPTANKIFEDYMPIGNTKDVHNPITDRLVECITRFIKKFAGKPQKVSQNDRASWQHGAGVYGKAIANNQ